MAKKSETKRSSNRSTRQSGRSRTSKARQGVQKQAEPQTQRNEENLDMEDE